MFLKNVVDEASNHDFVMQRSIGSETKHFYTNGHLRQPTPFSGECWMWPNQRIWQMAQFCIQHQFKLEVYQIFFKKSILHQKTLIFPIHHLFFFWLLGGSKWVWSWKKPVSRWIRFGVKYITGKWLLSIKVLTFRDFGVISWVTSYWDILKVHLNDHLIRLLKWKYGVWAIFCRVERPHIWFGCFNVFFWKKFIYHYKNSKK